MYNQRVKIGIRILIVLVVLAAVLGGGYVFLKTYTIQTVYVEGNVHYTEDEIKSFVMDGAFGNNSLYLSMKYRNKGVENIPFIDVMDVSILAPDTIKITVYEKTLVGYVQYLDTCMYFDKDGYVVESSEVKTVGIPQIAGLNFDHMILGEQLPVEDPAIFSSVLDITKLLDKYELSADKIYFHASNEITLYFGDVKVALGNEQDRMEDKVMLLPVFLAELEGKSGTLQMENYDESGGKYTFKPDF